MRSALAFNCVTLRVQYSVSQLVGCDPKVGHGTVINEQFSAVGSFFKRCQHIFMDKALHLFCGTHNAFESLSLILIYLLDMNSRAEE